MENLTAQFLHSTTLQKPPPPLWNLNSSFLSSLTKPYSIPKPSSLRRSLPLSLDGNAAQSTPLLAYNHHHNHRFLNSLLRRLDHPGSCPLRLLQEDADWSKDHFWSVIRFLRNSSRLHEILPVFDTWKNLDRSRISEANYERIIRLLCEEGSMNEAIRAFHCMIDEDHELSPSLEIYNSIIHGYANDGKFEEAMFYLNQMKENDLLPVTETYDGLIEAYGKWKMYDEIVLCLKRMESDGCVRDHVTYNLLIREFSRGGLLKRMEQMYQSLMSRKMTLQPSTLLSMLEAYAEFGVLEKMEETYDKIIRFGISLDEGLVRKLANVYIDNHMFSRLDDLGRSISSRTRRTNLSWCLRLLCHARLVSRKGVDYVVKEMEEARVTWNTTFANVALLAYSKMGHFKSIELLLSELRRKHVELDLVTVGIIFDLSEAGFDGTGVFMTWKKIGFLDKPVEMKTDPLVHATFGKGQFLRSCEEVKNQSLGTRGEESKSWTYQYLMELVVKNQKTIA